ncbi:rhodanese-like domain-containing protein [Pontimicrobium sp. MEBiC01747]|jgi:rhodanese-related sulfurtransferase
MKQLSITFSLLLVLFLSSCSDQAAGEITVVSTEEMETLLKLDDVQLIDVRTEREHKNGHLALSQNIDFNSPTFEEDIKKLDKLKPVILYCQGGGRSAKCAKKLKDAGFVKIYDLEGGFSKWQHHNLDLKLKKKAKTS